MKKNLLILISIIFLAIILRVYKFSQIPSSLNWDEIAIGWNSAAIWEAKIDQYGTRWPLSFKSYGDFKAPLYIYGLSPLIGIFGAKIWVVRLPSLLAGILSIVLIYSLAKELSIYLNLSKKQTNMFSLFSAFLMAIAPWTIFYSRAAYEANLAFVLILAGVYFFIISLKSPALWILSGLSFILSLYAYHSPKIIVPLILLSLFLVFRKEFVKQIKIKNWFLLIYLIILCLILYPLVKDIFWGQGGERAGNIIFIQNNQLVKFDINILKQILSNLIKHLNPLFYILGDNRNFRNQLSGYGLISLINYLFFIIGIWKIFTSKNQISRLLIIWYFIFLLPGILSQPDATPHAIRTFNSLIPMILISSFALVKIKTSLTAKKNKIFNLIIILFFIIEITRFCYEYFVKFPIYSVKDWQYGYEQVAKIAQNYEGNINKIIITKKIGHPYEALAFYQQRNPLYVIWGEMNKYSFVNEVNWEADKQSSNTLIIGTADEIPNQIEDGNIDFKKEIRYPNQEIAFQVVKTK